ncbi:MAG TPA: hypothetical protein VK914_11795 [bacterium]|jgi:hypothetical protein|nr:hypothetical protein [bacterium]
MMIKRCVALALLLAAAFVFSGCAGVVEFKTPPQFDHKKTVEDPPEGMLRPGETGTRLC